MAPRELDIIKQRINVLSRAEKVELIGLLNKSLSKNDRSPRLLQYGKYRSSGHQMSSPEDFKIAEWHPTDSDLDVDPLRS